MPSKGWQRSFLSVIPYGIGICSANADCLLISAPQVSMLRKARPAAQPGDAEPLGNEAAMEDRQALGWSPMTPTAGGQPRHALVLPTVAL
jgi:hypothetical protein